MPNHSQDQIIPAGWTVMDLLKLNGGAGGNGYDTAGNYAPSSFGSGFGGSGGFGGNNQQQPFTFQNPNAYTSWGDAKGFGDYMSKNGGLFMGGLQALLGIGGAVGGFQQLGLAKKSFGLEKRAYETNLRNQTQSYNTQVSDRIAGRHYGSEAERMAALQAALLPVPEDKKKGG